MKFDFWLVQFTSWPFNCKGRVRSASVTLTVGLSAAIFRDPSESSVGLLNVLVTNSGAVLKCFAASKVSTEERDAIRMLVTTLKYSYHTFFS